LPIGLFAGVLHYINPEEIPRLTCSLNRESVEELLEFRPKRLPGLVVVGSQQAIVNEYFERTPVKLQLAAKRRFLFQPIACFQRGALRLSELRLKSAVQCGFAVVQQSEPVLPVIEAIVRLVPNQKHSRAGGHVPVISDVNQHLGTATVPNPLMEYGDGIG
jgi:hypothetical protein